MNQANIYDTLTTIILTLIILIPILVFGILSLMYQQQNEQYKPNKNNFVIHQSDIQTEILISNLSEYGEEEFPTNMNNKCFNYIRWVYSNKDIDPLYKKQNIKTFYDAYKWVLCDKENIKHNDHSDACQNLRDSPRIMSKINCN